MTNPEYMFGHVRKMTKEQRETAIAERVIPFVASTSDPDRHGTVVNQKNWQLENFNANPIIGYNHNVYGDDLFTKSTPKDIIGRGENARIEADGNLHFDLRFKPEGRSEIADDAFLDVVDGFLNAVSVGFISVPDPETGETKRRGIEEEGEDPDLKYFYGQELLEISVVNIPSNPKALAKQLVARGVDLEKYDQLTVKELIQSLKAERFEHRSVGKVPEFESDPKVEFEDNGSEEPEVETPNSTLSVKAARKKVDQLIIKSKTK